MPGLWGTRDHTGSDVTGEAALEIHWALIESKASLQFLIAFLPSGNPAQKPFSTHFNWEYLSKLITLQLLWHSCFLGIAADQSTKDYKDVSVCVSPSAHSGSSLNELNNVIHSENCSGKDQTRTWLSPSTVFHPTSFCHVCPHVLILNNCSLC